MMIFDAAKALCRSAPPGATQADRAVEPMGIGPARNPAGGRCNLIFLGEASSSQEILDGC